MKFRSHILTVSLSLLASPAFAEEAGMPQLDPTWFPSQIFWLAVSFVLLYTIVSLLITPRVGGVLETRAEAINEAIALAEKLKKQAASTKGNFEQITAEARLAASQLIGEAQGDVAKEAAIANEDLSKDLAIKMAAAETEIKKSTARAVANLDAAAIPLAKEMVEKLLGSKVDETAIRTAVGDVSKAA
jgi:F-type H+-transporting ATPase subunit b